jgi:KaiC/GvpD/RAD55 family RecA-like ATPase
VFDILKTGIDGLDALLCGGIRYPAQTAAFVFITGGPGSGKTLLALEMVARAWLGGANGSTCLYYSVEQTPDNLHKKLALDFEFFRKDAEVTLLEQEVPHKTCLEARTARGRSRLVLTQANPAGLERSTLPGAVVDVDWIQAEIGNYKLAGPVHMVCIDNIGLLLTDLDYFAKRTALLETRRVLASQRIHGVFVQEEADPHSLRMPSAEEFSTDLLLRLSFAEQMDSFKARCLEIQKARHQYYYRGAHHFSIAGRGLNRNVYLGARSERGPGTHIYPSVAAQLSMARDSARFEVPRRGTQPIDLGHPDLDGAFLEGTGPTANSSTVLLAEPGTRHTYLALRFLAAGHRAGEETLLVSTKEDRDALARITARESALRGICGADGEFDRRFRILHLHPEYVSPGKFTWDIVSMTTQGHGDRAAVARLAFDNISRLRETFPLLDNERFLVRALLDLLRYRSISTFFVDIVPPGSSIKGRIDPAPYMTTFDNVFHVYFDDYEGEERLFLRVLKSVANDFTQSPMLLDLRRA